MDERLSTLAKQIQSKYSSISEKAKSARSSVPSLVLKINKIPIGLSVAAVDGGLLYQRMHGADIVLCRSVGVILGYSDSKLASHSHIPSKIPEPDLELMHSLDEHEAAVFRSLIRLKHELSRAIGVLEKNKVDVLLMDGSLLPVPSDRPAEASDLFPLYSEILGLYEKLFALSREKNCLLFGVIKDSRSKKFADSLSMGCPDILFCNYLLSECERTKDFPYFDEKPAKDIAHLGADVRVFYMKPSKNDFPLRIEFLDSGQLDKAASIICSLCAISDQFAYPAALIEADLCAALDPTHIEPIESSLMRLAGMRPLRRNSRPFR
jgi:hypothetical protein